MQIVEMGSGPPLVLLPGVQGRWEYVRPAAEALASAFRVLTFDLGDEPSSGLPFDRTRGFAGYVQQVEAALDRSGIDRAVICGISFGGLIALAFSAAHPARTSALVLASTPGPGWHLRRRHEFYTRHPQVFGPLFLAESPWRLRRELAAAFPKRLARWRFAAVQLRTLARAPLSLGRMAYRARLIQGLDTRAACAAVVAPTLIVTGEPGLDHVVTAEGSAGYLAAIRSVRSVTLKQTGHLGSITRPEAFAALVADFASGRVREVA